MKVVVCSGHTLDYRGDSDAFWRGVGESVERLLAALRESDDARVVWVLQQHHGFVLLAEDDVFSPRYVEVKTLQVDDYAVSFRLPQGQSPWPGSVAYVEGAACSPGQAAEMVQIGMDRSEGWRDAR